MTKPAVTAHGVVVIEPTTPLDTWGRRQFFAYWYAHNVGPSMPATGTRCQVFRTEYQPWIDRHVADGFVVITRDEFERRADDEPDLCAALAAVAAEERRRPDC